MFNYDKLYTKEAITAHTKDYLEAKKNIKFTKDTLKYLRYNILCYKLYKLIAFLHYELKLNYLQKPIIILFKYMTKKVQKLGEEL